MQMLPDALINYNVWVRSELIHIWTLDLPSPRGDRKTNVIFPKP